MLGGEVPETLPRASLSCHVWLNTNPGLFRTRIHRKTEALPNLFLSCLSTKGETEPEPHISPGRPNFTFFLILPVARVVYS